VLKIGGLTPFTSIDYPAELAAVVFCQGCPWRCGYCHNHHLLDTGISGAVTWEEVLAFLDRRRGLLDAVVFSGGEPTMQPGLQHAVRETRSMGFLVGLHTAGAFPERLKKLLPHLDWVGMDVKAPFEDYEMITGIPGSGENAEISAEFLIQGGVSCEFRTTLHPMLTNDGGRRLLHLAHALKNMGAKRFAIQRLRPMDGNITPGASPFQAVEHLLGSVTPLFDSFFVRE
jgi:pyruvate formate lyase activating enzyme